MFEFCCPGRLRTCCKRHRSSDKLIRSVALLFVATLLLLGGCTTTVIPPAQVAHPVTVYILDHGRTPSLVLPVASDVDADESEPVRPRLIRYAYGDWNYYALRKNGLWHGVAALLWPTQGTLGRKQIEFTADINLMMRRFAIGVEHVYSLQVERDRVNDLQQRLDQIFESNLESRVVNEAYSFEFVHHPRRYTAFYNSNHAVADWLRELDCDVRSVALTSRWRIDSPERSQ